MISNTHLRYGIHVVVTASILLAIVSLQACGGNATKGEATPEGAPPNSPHPEKTLKEQQEDIITKLHALVDTMTLQELQAAKGEKLSSQGNVNSERKKCKNPFQQSSLSVFMRMPSENLKKIRDGFTETDDIPEKSNKLRGYIRSLYTLILKRMEDTADVEQEIEQLVSEIKTVKEVKEHYFLNGGPLDENFANLEEARQHLIQKVKEKATTWSNTLDDKMREDLIARHVAAVRNWNMQEESMKTGKDLINLVVHLHRCYMKARGDN